MIDVGKRVFYEMRKTIKNNRNNSQDYDLARGFFPLMMICKFL